MILLRGIIGFSVGGDVFLQEMSGGLRGWESDAD